MIVESRGGRLGWAASAALLSIALAVAALWATRLAVGRVNFLSMQSLLALAPWLASAALGFDKSARRAASDCSWAEKLARALPFSLAASCLAGALVGAACARVVGEPWGGWVIFCALGAATFSLNSGRELLLARGRAALANKILCAGHLGSLLCALWMGIHGLSFEAFALGWMGAQCAAAAWAASAAGLMAKPSLQGFAAWRDITARDWTLGAQVGACVALASLDIVAVRGSLGAVDALRYALLTRCVFVAFNASIPLGSLLIENLNRAQGTAWIKTLGLCAALHFAASLGAATLVAWTGERWLEALVPASGAWGAVEAFWPALAALAAARSCSEACFAAAQGGRARSWAAWSGAGSLAGLALMAGAGAVHLEQALWLAAAAWCLPALACLLKTSISRPQ